MNMTILKFADISKFQGALPNYGDLDGLIINATPQNTVFPQQRQHAYDTGKLTSFYLWPGAFGAVNAYAEGVAACDYIKPLPGEQIIWLDVEDESISAMGFDPVQYLCDWSRAVQDHGYSAGVYMEARIVKAYNWSKAAAQDIALWVAAWSGPVSAADIAPWTIATAQQDDNHEPYTGGDSDDVFCTLDQWHALAHGGNSPAAAPVPAPAPAHAAAPVRYTVVGGDSLSAIGERFGVAWQTIQSANGITNPDLIYPGQVLTIPDATQNTPAPAPTHVYVVRPGDTLSGIAGDFGTTYQELASINGIANPDIIFPGQVIRLP